MGLKSIIWGKGGGEVEMCCSCVTAQTGTYEWNLVEYRLYDVSLVYYCYVLFCILYRSSIQKTPPQTYVEINSIISELEITRHLVQIKLLQIDWGKGRAAVESKTQ
jgi:hypothetical protein